MRQLAAILFTDMQGYTALMARDEALARRLRDRHRTVLRDCHERFQGEIVQYFGDGTLSLFGSAVEAVRCAVDIQRALQEEPKVPLRIGLHFGEVVRDEEGLYGSAVNIASRLESLATAGSILISARIREELSNHPDFLMQSLGLFELKNVPQAMEVFAIANDGIVVPKASELDGKGKLIQGTALSPPLRLRNFVGREKELEQLRHVWHDARNGKGAMIGIAGEPGIGKTTLVEDFLLEVGNNSSPFTIARGRCSERLAGTEAYLPFLEILDALIRDERIAALLKQVAPAWYVQLRPYSVEESKTLEMAIQATQERRKRELGNYFQEMAKQQPLLLFIDDLHWADASSIDLLAYLAPRISNNPALLLTSYRPADMKVEDHPFLGLKPDLLTKRLFRELPLPFLQMDEIDSYLNFKYPQNEFPDDLARRLQKRTEGNALFMVDLIEDLENRKLIVNRQGTWIFDTSDGDLEKSLPASIKGMIHRKIDRLEESDVQILSIAAVQGYEFDAVIIAEVASRDILWVEERLGFLEDHFRFVKLEGERRFPDGTFSEHYRFIHALYRHAFFETLSLNRRTARCRKVGQMLEQYYQNNTAEIASQLAQLYELALDAESALTYYRTAIQNAEMLSAFHEVKLLARKGLALLSNTSSGEGDKYIELELLQALGNASMVTEGYGHNELLNINNRALELCKRVVEPNQQISIMLGLMSYYFMNGHAREVEEIRLQIIALAQTREHALDLGLAYHLSGNILIMSGNLSLGTEHLEKALPLFQSQRENTNLFSYTVDGESTLNHWLSQAHLLSGYPDQSKKMASKAIQRARNLNHPPSLAFVLLTNAVLHHWTRDTDSMLNQIREGLSIAVDHDFPYWISYGLILQGWTMVMELQDSTGIEKLEIGLKGYMDIGAVHFQAYFHGLLIEAYLFLGRLEDASSKLEDAFVIISKSDEKFFAPELFRLKGALLLDKGAKPDDIENLFFQAIELAQEHQYKWWELRSTVSLARLWLLQGKIKEAYDRLKAIYDWFTEGFDTVDLKEAKALLDALKANINESNKPPSIAVLPFTNMSPDPNQEYFCDGVTEEILNALAQVRDLRVIARTSAFSFKGQNVDIREIARQLGVDHLLEGSVRKAEKRLRITAQLIKAEDGSHLWSERFDRELEDVFDIQDEIALLVSSRLQSSLTKSEDVARRNTENIKAYEMYLQGRFFFHKRSAVGMAKAMEYFTKAIELDPDYALAYAGLADVYILIGIGYGNFPQKEAYLNAEKSARDALEIDNRLAEAHTSLGYILMNIRDMAGAKKHYEQALQLNPGLVQAHQWYAHYLLTLKQHEEASYHINRALQIDPLSILLRTESGWPLMFTARYQEAISLYETILTMEPSFALARYDLAQCLGMLGRYEQALSEIERAVRDSGNSVFALSYQGYINARAGNEEKARRLLHRLKGLYQRGAATANFIADIYIGLEEKSEALQWLEKAEQEGIGFTLTILDQWISRILGSNLLDEEPRYQKLLKRMKLSSHD